MTTSSYLLSPEVVAQSVSPVPFSLLHETAIFDSISSSLTAHNRPAEQINSS